MRVSMTSADNVPGKQKKRKEPEGKKRPYSAPLITSYGRLRDVTLGGSPGRGDSGSSLTKHK
jgi:hypothetical protein